MCSLFNLVGLAVEQGQRVYDDDITEGLEPIEYEDLEETPEHDGDWEEEELRMVEIYSLY